MCEVCGLSESVRERMGEGEREEEMQSTCDSWKDLLSSVAELISSLTKMPNYTVTVATGTQWFAGTDDYIYMTLVGSESCSERTLLDKPLYNDFERGAVRY